MYYESIFSLRQDSSKLCSFPVISYLSPERHLSEAEAKVQPWWSCWVLSFLSTFQKLRGHSDQRKKLNFKRHVYGRALMMHSCAIDPIDSGAEFHEDALEDRPRFAYGYKKDPFFHFCAIALEIMSLGLTWIIFHWFPLWKFTLCHYPCPLLDATHVVIYTQKGEEHVVEVFRPGISPSEAVQFDNWPGFCSSCGLKKKNPGEKLLEPYGRLPEELISYSDLLKSSHPTSTYPCDHSPEDNNNNLSEIYIEEWCTCLEIICCNMHGLLHTHLLMFQFRLLRYYLNLRENVFDIIHFNTQLNPVALHKTLGQGILSETIYESRRSIFGVETTKPYPLWKMIIEELAEPFYVFQVCSVILWVWDEYLEYAYIVIALMILSSLYDIYIARDCERRVLQLALDLSFPVNAFRFWSNRSASVLPKLEFTAQLYENEFLLNQGMKTVSAGSLQPGDVFEIERDMIMPCDAVLLWGSVIVSETVLSGESVPQTKTALPGAYHIDESKGFDTIHCFEVKEQQDKMSSVHTMDKKSSCNIEGEYKIDQDTRHTLYAGTHIVGFYPLAKGQRVMGLCCRTRFLSSHGRLLRSSLFPNGPFFDFNVQALQFFFYMFLSCSLGAIVSIITGVYFEFDTKVIVIRTLDLFTDALPPALPAILGMGIVVATRHLRSRYQINCIHAGRINLAGLVDTFVFDKTGTLTEQGLQFNGCFQVETVLSSFNPLETFSLAKHQSKPFLRQARIFARRKTFRARQLLKMYQRNTKKLKENIEAPLSKHFRQVPSVSSTFNQKNVSQVKYFGSRLFDPSSIKGYFAQALATCHSLSLVNGELIGDPLELSLIKFTQWKIHDIQQDIQEVETFIEHLKNTNEPSGQSSLDYCDLSKISPTQAVIQQLSLLYGTTHHVPVIMLPPDTNLSLFQHLRRSDPFFFLNKLADNKKQCNQHRELLKNAFSIPRHAKSSFHELGILHRFEFSASLQRVTVIVRDPLTLAVYVYSKGSPEVMATLCTSESLPPSFYSTIAHYTQNGDRVVVVGGKHLGKLSDAALSNLTRRRAERNITLLGFVLFSNCLKSDTKKTIQELNEAKCRCIIATGDNPLTALSVAKSCGILQSQTSKEIILGDLYVSSEHTQESTDVPPVFVWTKVEKFKNNHHKLLTRPRLFIKQRTSRFRTVEDTNLDIYSLLKKQWQKRVTLDLGDFLRGKNPRQCEFILTGRAFRKLRMLHEELQLQWYDDTLVKSPSSIDSCHHTDVHQRLVSQPMVHHARLSRPFDKLLRIFGLNRSRNDFSNCAGDYQLLPSCNCSYCVRENYLHSTSHQSSRCHSNERSPRLDFQRDFHTKHGHQAFQIQKPQREHFLNDVAEHHSSSLNFRNKDFNYITGRFLLEPCSLDDKVVTSLMCKKYDRTHHDLNPLPCKLGTTPCSPRNAPREQRPVNSLKWLRFPFLQPSSNIFNRSTTLHLLKKGRLQRHFELSKFLTSSLLHVSILAFGNHPKFLSKKHKPCSLYVAYWNPVSHTPGDLMENSTPHFLEFDSLSELKDESRQDFHSTETPQTFYPSFDCIETTPRPYHTPKTYAAGPSLLLRNIICIFDVKTKCCKAFLLPCQAKIKQCSYEVNNHHVSSSQGVSTLMPCDLPFPHRSTLGWNILRTFYEPFLHCYMFFKNKARGLPRVQKKKLDSPSSYSTYTGRTNKNNLFNSAHRETNKLEQWKVPLLQDSSDLNEKPGGCLNPQEPTEDTLTFHLDSCRGRRLVDYRSESSCSALDFPQTEALPKSNATFSDQGFPALHIAMPIHDSHVNDRVERNHFHSLDTSLRGLTCDDKRHKASFQTNPTTNRSYPVVREESAFIQPSIPTMGHSQTLPLCEAFQNKFSLAELFKKKASGRSNIRDLMLLSVVVLSYSKVKESSVASSKKHQRNRVKWSSCLTLPFSVDRSSDHYTDFSSQKIDPLNSPLSHLSSLHPPPSSSGSAHRRSELIRISLFEYLLRNTRIYARMVPEDKTSLITALRSLPHTLAVGMCGDSANDSGALQAADIGVSLNNDEKSIAAPFMSKSRSISSCVAILYEGRVSLENALEMFTFVVLYSMIQYISVLALYLYGLNFTDNQYLFVDFLVILPLSTLLSEVQVSSQLKASMPKINLFSRGFIVPIISHIAVSTCFMIFLLFSLRFTPRWTPFYITVDAGDSDGPEIASYENTALFYFTNFLYPLMSIVAAAQNRWRQERLSNWMFFISHGFLIVVFFVVILVSRPATILIPSFSNPSPEPLAIPPLKEIGWAAYLLVYIDQTLVLVDLPKQAKLLIVLTVVLYICAAATLQILVFEPYRKEEAELLRLRLARNRGPIPLKSYDRNIRVYHPI